MTTTVKIIPIPVSDGTAFSFETDLDGLSYWFDFHYNARGLFWTFDIFTSQRVLIQAGVSARVNYSLLAHCGSGDKPPGKLLLIDTAETNADPGPLDLGNRVLLAYIPRA